jgi:hypothetical protein
MAKLIVEEQKEFSLLPVDSILLLKVDEQKEIELQGAHGPWSKLEIKFKILGIQAIGDGSDPAGFEDMIAGPIWGSVPLRLTNSPDNKLRQWAEAIFGMELGIGFELDTDLFLGRQVRGITSQYKKKEPDSQGRPIFKHQIDALLPMGGNATPSVPQAQQQMQQVQQQQLQQDPWATPGQPVAANDPWAVPAGEEPPF